MAKAAVASKQTYKLPQGYESESDFLTEARERFTEAESTDRENRDEALSDLRFLAGEQWDDNDRAARKDRPMLTINQLPQFVAQVVGDIRINRPSIRVRPAEDADKDLAEIREGLIRTIERNSRAQSVYADTAQSQVGGGIGNFRVTLKYASDDGFDRDIAVDRIPDPFAVVWDPYIMEPSGADARFCFVVDEIPRKAFEETYPEAQTSELSVSLHEGWVKRDSVRVTEYWILKQTEVEIAMLDGGRVVDVDKLPPNVRPLKTRKVMRKSACMYLITGHAILSGPHELPIDRVPIFRVPGWEINVGPKKVRFGVVRFARDPQKLKNYWRSVAAETLALAPKGKWLLHHDAVPEPEMEDDFRASAKSSDPVLKWTGQVAPFYTPPPNMPAALLQEAAANTQDMKDVTGIHDASLGIRSNETSGRAIMARQREGDVANFVYTDNLMGAISEAGRVMNQLIPTVYDTARTVRILGEDESTKVQRINDPNHPESVDINQGKYDVSVETGPSYTTKRVEAAESMAAFFQAVPQAGAIAADLYAKAQDWPNADIIAERFRKSMPPQLFEGEEGQKPQQPDPAQQQAQQVQMQAQQMQMQGAQIELQEKQAGARKAEADADRAEADAAKAQLELAAMQGHGIAGDLTFGKGQVFNDPASDAQNMRGNGEMGSEPPPQPMAGGAGMGMPPMPPIDMSAPAPSFGQGEPTPDQPAPGEGFPAA